jgi:hypothetical protein
MYNMYLLKKNVYNEPKLMYDELYFKRTELLN